MQQIKAITFGLDGTLVHGALDIEKYKKALIDYLEKIGHSGGHARLNQALQATLEKMKKAQARKIELRFDLVYSNLLFDLGIKITQERLDHIEDLYMRFYKIEMVPGVKEMLEQLSKKYHLAVVANAVSNVARLALEKHDLTKYFDYIVLSRDLGARKPDPEIFIFALRSMWIKAENAVHVGDSLEEDVKGAKLAGMRTVWIKEDTEITNIHPDFVIPKITELPSLVDS
jgi:HAD superfamily hydrolase (TIGR01549 family)